MTHVELQQIVVDNIKEHMADSINLRQRIDISFGQWFRNLLAKAQATAPAPASKGANPTSGDGGAPPSGSAEGAPA